MNVLAVLPQLIPSTVIGVVKPLLALHRERRITLDVALESWVSPRRLRHADLVVFSRNTEPLFGAALETALELGKPIIYELDDDFFALPHGAPGSEYHRDPARLGQLERYVRNASLVRVYSEALRIRLTAYNPHVHRVTGLIDWDLVPPTPPARNPAVVRIVYATSRIVDPLAATFMPDLRRILDAFHGRVEVSFWGFRPTDLGGRPDVRFIDYVDDYDAFFRRFASVGFDIGIAPLPDEEFYRAKSDNKFREYAASRIAGVYSDVQVYRECVTHGQTGLLAPAVPDAWFSALKRLIEDDTLRTKIQDEAWACARARYSVERSKQVWLAHLEAAINNRTPLAPISRSGGAQGGARSRTFGLVRRTAQVFQGRQAPGAFSLGPRVRWHLRSTRSLSQLRRELEELGRKQSETPAARTAERPAHHQPSWSDPRVSVLGTPRAYRRLAGTLKYRVSVQRNGWCGLDVLVGTHGQSVQGCLVLRIMSETGVLLRERMVNLAGVHDNSWVEFRFGTIRNSGGLRFLVQLMIRKLRAGDKVSIFEDRDRESVPGRLVSRVASAAGVPIIHDHLHCRVRYA